VKLRLISALATHEIRAASPELYQDSTGLAHYRVTAKGDSRPFAPALAWIRLSHFGDLATVKDCHDPQMLAKIRGVLEEFGLKYIPYDYLAGKTNNGKSKALVGFSCGQRLRRASENPRILRSSRRASSSVPNIPDSGRIPR
jgi:hypothetical protein